VSLPEVYITRLKTLLCQLWLVSSHPIKIIQNPWQRRNSNLTPDRYFLQQCTKKNLLSKLWKQNT